MLRLWQNREKANIQLLFLACVWQLAALHSADSDDTLAGSLPHFKSQGIYDHRILQPFRLEIVCIF